MKQTILSRRNFIQSTGCGLVSGLFFNCSKKPKDRPNILWIVAEDVSQDLRCYGDPVAKTPHLDQLAAQGAIYKNAFAVSGVCAPSRSCLITGMYPTTIGTHHMRTTTTYNPFVKKPYLAVPPPFVKCFTEYLRAEGYYCVNRNKTDFQFGVPITAFDENSKQAHYSNRATGQPFFCAFHLSGTHESQIWKSKTQEPKTDPDKVKLPPYYPDTPVVRKDYATYYDNITEMDTEVGEILKELDRNGLADNTIVFFLGDHGRGFPRAKRWIYDAGIRVPLIIRWPGKIKPRSVSDDIVSFVDFAPTMLALAQASIPSHMQGKVFMGPRRSEPRQFAFAARDRMGEVYDRVRAVCGKKYKYIRNFFPEKTYAQRTEYSDRLPTMQEMHRLHALGKLEFPQTIYYQDTRPKEELYDLEKDPHEIHNLAPNPKYKDKLLKMRSVCEEWIQSTDDLGRIPEQKMVDAWMPDGIQASTSKPVIEPDGGQFQKNVQVFIRCPNLAASIAYTTDKSKNSHWLLYSTPIKLTTSCTLRAKAIRYGYKHSEQASSKFIIK